MEKEQAVRWKALQAEKQDRNNLSLNKDQASKWKKQHSSNGISFYTIGLWLILITSLVNGLSISANATSAIHQICSSVSFLIATLVFCALAIRSKISEEAYSIISSVEKFSKTMIEENNKNKSQS